MAKVRARVRARVRVRVRVSACWHLAAHGAQGEHPRFKPLPLACPVHLVRVRARMRVKVRVRVWVRP